MSLGSQFRALGRQSAAFRKELFGTAGDGTPVKFSYDRGARRDIEGCYQFVKRRFWTEEAGALEQQGAIIRWNKWDGTEANKLYNFAPEIQKQITFKDATGRELTFVIEDLLGFHHASVEWVLGCRLL